MFQDADYIGLSDILLSIAKGEGFTSAYYSESGQGSFLSHHFAPGMAVLSPFVSLIPNRWGLAVGVFFIYQLGTILWLLWAYRITKINPTELGIKFLVFWVLVTNQLYLYRIGSSFHFEVLVILFGFFFFYSWEQRTKLENSPAPMRWIYYSILILSLLFYLIQKEDIGIYLFLFFLPVLLKLLYELAKSKRQNLAFPKENKFYLLVFLFAIISIWLGFVFVIYPKFGDISKSVTWTKILTQEYHVAFKQVTGFQKSFQIFLELVISGGLGIFQMIPELLGIGFIYATHIISTRPWHHEVYTYYSYSLIPFVLYTGILWLQSAKKISLFSAFLILACLFWKNSLDQNFPLNTNVKSPWANPTMEKEIQSDLKVVNPLLLSQLQESISLESRKVENSLQKANSNQSIDTIENTERIFVFSQYNLSFFISDRIKTFPLEQIKNSKSICGTENICYAVFTPDFTDETLWPKSRILTYKKEWEDQKGYLFWKGKQVEVWKW